MPKFLRFGIPSLDKLIGADADGNFGFNLSPKKGKQDSTGICIIGPDGTGKSVFALHLASQYLADCLVENSHFPTRELPQILYISTDLSHGKAIRTWEHFGLDKPFARISKFEPVSYPRGISWEVFNAKRALLQPYPPAEVVQYVQASRQPGDDLHKICFIDLAASTAGDDWGFLHRLLALLQKPAKDSPPHLLIIDAVEGFETYAGQHDAFGERSSRRARIAQLARLAGDKAHTLLIVEKMQTAERLPEEFVADIVIHLRNVEANKYLRRTIEIEKTRGQSHVRGQHPFSIRMGKGSTTGSQENVDDPTIPVDRDDGGYPYQDYVQVFPSLSYLNRAIMAQTHAPRAALPKDQFAGFGIRYLDNMLGGEAFEAGFHYSNNQFYDTRGLPCGTVTALIGDSLTQKTRLGKLFLSRGFFPFSNSFAGDHSLKDTAKELRADPKVRAKIDKIERLIEERTRTYDLTTQLTKHRELSRLKREVTKQPAAQRLLRQCGVAMLFTTIDTHHEALVSEFLDMFSVNGYHERLIAQILIESRTICRRMEIHDVPASTFAHIFERNIRAAKQILRDDAPTTPIEASRIRVVFDDFSSFRNTYREVSEDPLFLPYLLFFLGREGVTALIIDTQSISKPDLALTERYESELRELVQYRLYTWRVPFYGENRVAITAIPPFSPATSGAIRELRWEGREEPAGTSASNLSRLVNPHFELYRGLEEGKLQPVPIEVRFYAENEAFHRYLELEETRFGELFLPYEREGQSEKAVVFFRYGSNDYNTMRDFCGLQRGTRLDHTLVFQVDEFWTQGRQKAGRTGAFRNQWNYLKTPTWEREIGRDDLADPYAVFQPTKTDGHARFERLDFYDPSVPYIKAYKDKKAEQDLKRDLDRVPFSWDFGFLLCKASAWTDAAKELLVREKPGLEAGVIRGVLDHPTVGSVWDSLTKATSEKKKLPIVSWFDFLAAGKRVAEHQSYKNPSVARTFDFSVLSPETFPCLILEIWASEIWKDEAKNWNGNESIKWREMKQLTQRPISHLHQSGPSLLKWLKPDRDKDLSSCVRRRYGSDRVPESECGFSLQLYKTWLLLIEAIDFSQTFATLNAFALELKARQVDSSAVAARHWYKSACQFNESLSEQELENNWLPVRLPGRFSVRGDWFLTVARGSRSSRLADRALDLFGSKRANITRLQEGIGLPVRNLLNEDGGGPDLRTRLVTIDADLPSQRLRALPYNDFLNIAPSEEDEDFFWFWRSSLSGFNSGLRIWHRWLSQMIIWWRSKKLKYASSWTSGFEIYAELEALRKAESSQADQCEALLPVLENLDTWKEFHHRVRDLIDSLNEVNVETD